MASRSVTSPFLVLPLGAPTNRTHNQALENAKATKNGKPKLIVCKTIIGKGIDAVAGTNAAHGEAGVAYTDESRKSIGLPEEKWFVSEDTRSFFKDHASSLSKTCVFFFQALVFFQSPTVLLNSRSRWFSRVRTCRCARVILCFYFYFYSPQKQNH